MQHLYILIIYRKLIELPPLHQIRQSQSSQSSETMSKFDDEKSSPRRILCIDGGGAKGVVPLEILRELERKSGVRTRDQFDLFCGTSTVCVNT